MPSINTDNNYKYGGPEGINKYSPLRELKLNPEDSVVCNGLVNGRTKLLSRLATFPSDLYLYASNWDGIKMAEGEQTNPPIVVVSSNRSSYIAKGDATAKTILGTQTGFNNISDVRSLLGTQPASPPVYLPVRLGPTRDRSVYVVVHVSEYTNYQGNLANTGITVIGWAFSGSPHPPLTGFGATRYAAIEFCKYLRNLAGHAWDYAWMFDDNVVGFASGKANNPGLGFPNLLTDVENAMRANANTVVAGFHGLPMPRSRGQNRGWAWSGQSLDEAGNFQKDLPARRGPGLVQQAALWNIAYLMTNDLNFSSIFIASKEDVSFTTYFDKQNLVYWWYDRINILKEIVDPKQHDNQLGARHVNQAREAWQRAFSRIAANTIQTVNEWGFNSLGDYVEKVVLPQSQYFRASLPNGINLKRGVCCAVEQIITAAIEQGTRGNFLSADALDSMFKVAANTQQVIKAIDQ